MHQEMQIHCPNCGAIAQRFLSDQLPTGKSCPGKQVLQTECAQCDYFMVMCVANGSIPLPFSFTTTLSY